MGGVPHNYVKYENTLQNTTSNPAAVQCLLWWVAYQHSDVSSCGSLTVGPQSGMEMLGQVAGAICLKSTQMIGHTKHTQKLMAVLAFAVMLTLNTAIQSTYKTMVMIKMYHPTKFDCKRIRNSVNIKQNIKKSYFDHNFMSPYILIIQVHMMTLTLKLANQLFSWHSGSKWFFTIPSLVTNGSVVQKISPGWTFIEILNIAATIT